MQTKRLSLCIITRDEENNLHRCLESVKGVVDDIVLLDTGSIDSTIQIARKYGAIIHQMSWPGDFATARNTCLDYAAGEWILLMDADEELLFEDRNKVRGLMDVPGAEAYLFTIYNLLGNPNSPENVEAMTSVRMIKNRKEYRFEGLLHEQIGESILRYLPDTSLINSGVHLKHYGYLDNPGIKSRKSQRNLSIAQLAVHNNPEDAYANYYLGVEYQRLGDCPKAEIQYKQSRKYLNTKAMWASKLYKDLASNLLHQQKWSEARQIVQEGISLWPDYTDLLYLEGIIEYNNQNYARAVGCFTQCLVLGVPATPPYAVTEQGLASYKSYFALGQTYEKLGKLPDAYQSYEKALTANRNWTAPLLAMARIMFTNVPLEDARKVIEGYFQLNNYGDLIRLADLVVVAKEPGLALEYLDKAVALAGESEQIYYLRGCSLAKMGEYDRAIENLEMINGNSPYYRDAILYLSYCFWSIDDAAKARDRLQTINAGKDEFAILAKMFFEEAKDILRAGIKHYPHAQILKQRLAELDAGGLEHAASTSS